MKQKVWFITGTSRGFGKIWAEAALQRGDKVAATARDTEALKELEQQFGDAVLAIKLDVADRQACFDAIQQARQHFGHLDVVINNAGYGQFGMIEELSEMEARKQMDTNFFGVLWITQAALPIMREQKDGHIIQVSSVGGIVSFQNLGVYHASKWALEGLTESLSQEVKDFGIRVTLIEPAVYGTDWGSSAKFAAPVGAYDHLKEESKRLHTDIKSANPNATGDAILKVVDAEQPPLRIFFGGIAIPYVESIYQKRLENWRQWESVSVEAQGIN